MTPVRPSAIHTLDDLVACVPHLLGFHPTNSVVIVVVRGSRVWLTARWDMDVSQTAIARWLDQQVSSGFPAVDGGQCGAFLVGYGERRRTSGVVRELSERIATPPLAALVVDQDCWWSIADSGPASGHAFLGAAKTVFNSRAELAQSIAGPVGQREDEMLGRWAQALDRVDGDDPAGVVRLLTVLMDAWHEEQTVSDDDYLTAAVATTVSAVRDELWRGLTAERAHQFLQFWEQVLVRTPLGVRTSVLAVTAMYAWAAGNGVLMNICLEEARQIDPEFPLVRSLGHLAEQRVCQVPERVAALTTEWAADNRRDR